MRDVTLMNNIIRKEYQKLCVYVKSQKAPIVTKPGRIDFISHINGNLNYFDYYIKYRQKSTRIRVLNCKSVFWQEFFSYKPKDSYLSCITYFTTAQ